MPAIYSRLAWFSERQQPGTTPKRHCKCSRFVRWRPRLSCDWRATPSDLLWRLAGFAMFIWAPALCIPAFCSISLPVSCKSSLLSYKLRALGCYISKPTPTCSVPTMLIVAIIWSLPPMLFFNVPTAFPFVWNYHLICSMFRSNEDRLSSTELEGDEFLWLLLRLCVCWTSKAKFSSILSKRAFQLSSIIWFISAIILSSSIFDTITYGADGPDKAFNGWAILSLW